MWKINQSKVYQRLSDGIVYAEAGKVVKSLGMIYEADLPGASVGSQCEIVTSHFQGIGSGTPAEVVGFKEKRIILMALNDATGINSDSLVVLRKKSTTVPVGPALLGRVIDAMGEPIDGKGPIEFGRGDCEELSLYQEPADTLSRKLIREPLQLGVRAIDGLLTCGKGQRVGVMAGSGVGKSVLLGMISRNTQADVNVIALIGERGREVREFIEKDLGPEAMERSVVIVATSNQSALLRKRGAFLATTIAEYFRDEGQDVLLMMDSLTRLCMAQREIGLSVGEPPASKGYTPSVFSLLPKLLERAGTTAGEGSITGLYTVLVEGDDMDDPIGDSARSILDGHIVLDRKLAQRNHYPSIDVMQSASRVMNSVITEDHLRSVGQIKEWMALYRQVEDLINLGAYVKGNNPSIDQAIAVHSRIDAFLRQDMNESANFAETQGRLLAILRAGEAFLMPEGSDSNAQAPVPVRSQAIQIG